MSNVPAIRVEAVSKTYGRGQRQIRAVNGVDLEVQPGQVFGLLGPNGAGKTTLIRMLLDLIRPTTGRLALYGQDVQLNHAVLKRVGALVESPAAYSYLSARENLAVLAHTAGHYDRARIDDLLRQVGLADRAGQAVKGYSLGMKQRLGLAAALLGSPDLLILDEPTNGLDPAGIQELRGFIREQVDKQGRTVCLSSHLLNEVEQVCDRVAIINKGKIVREGRVADLLAASNSRIRVNAAPIDRAAAILRAGWKITATEPDALIVDAPREAAPAIVRQLVEAALDVYEVTIERQTLEAYFLDVTGGAVSSTTPKETTDA